MEAVFLILITGLAGYVAYAYVFVRKGPAHHPARREGSLEADLVSCEKSLEDGTRGFSRDRRVVGSSTQNDLREAEAFSQEMLGPNDQESTPKARVFSAGAHASLVPQSMVASLQTWAFDTFYAEQRRARMQAKCLHEFPEMLDILTLGLKAGLSFDGSLELYTSRYNSLLSLLLSHSMIVWKLGLASRVHTLDMLSSRLGIGAFTRFSMAVAEALEFGIPLADSLSRQATEIRREQRLQVEEGIEKIPVKMLIPMGVFVVPAMLLAILGPLLSSAFKMG